MSSSFEAGRRGCGGIIHSSLVTIESLRVRRSSVVSHTWVIGSFGGTKFLGKINTACRFRSCPLYTLLQNRVRAVRESETPVAAAEEHYCRILALIPHLLHSLHLTMSPAIYFSPPTLSDVKVHYQT